MHEAYEVTHLLSATAQIETLVAYENNLLLGTRQGHLIMYSLSTNNGNHKYEVQLLTFCKNFSKKPIQQIQVIPEDNLLLCLTDNLLSSYDINGLNFPLIKTYTQTKGASLFSIDTETTRPPTGTETRLVRLAVAVKRKIIIYLGNNGEFKQHLYNISVPDVPSVVCWGRNYICVGFKTEYSFYNLTDGKPKQLFPTISMVEPTIAKYSDTCFLIGRDKTTVMVDETTQEIGLGNIKWAEAPVAFVWDEPFILGLLQDQIVVQTAEPSSLIQTLPELNKARLLCRCRPGVIVVASVGQVWCVSAVEVTRQRQMLLKDKNFELAIKLTKLSSDTEEAKKQKIHSIQMLHALDLFDSKRYSESMAEFVKLEMDPAEVIRLFPDLGGGPKSPEEEVKAMMLHGEDLQNAISALIEYLTEMRKIQKKAKAEIEKATREALEAEKKAEKDPNAEKMAPRDREKDAAMQKKIAHMLELIDTILLKCYLKTNDALIAPLLRLNNCKFDEAEKTLLEHKKHSELIILYQTNGQHTKALELLKEQAKQPDSSLRGHERSVSYLQSLGAENIHLIFQFSGWLLRDHPEDGLKIFTDDLPEVESLPRPKVLDFLLREHEPVVVPYLEHVVHVWKDNNPVFHNGLIRIYREKIVENKSALTEDETKATQAKLLQFLRDSPHYTPEIVLLHLPVDSLLEERAVVLGKLGRHDKALDIYVQILGDVEKAIEYCESVYSREDERSQDVFVSLVRILMNPSQTAAQSGPLSAVPRHPKTAIPDLETTLVILNKHADKIDPVKALSVLPDSVPLSRLSGFLQCALDTQLTQERRSRIVRSLQLAENNQVREMKISRMSQKVVIDQSTLCLTCRKPFINQSAFVRYPNGDIVHYSCRRDKSASGLNVAQ